MEPEARAQVRLIIEDADDLAGKAISDGLASLFADHASKGLLQSGGTVKAGVRILEEEGSKFVSGLIDQVATVAKDLEAFAMIREAFERFLSQQRERLEKIISMAAGNQSQVPSSIRIAAGDLWRGSKERLSRQVELHRFAFTVPSKPTFIRIAEEGAASRPPTSQNKGGKPLAAHWDEMWADIAIMLWEGDLKPETQADIQRAMFEWFSSRGIDVGETAVRNRARQLWLKYETAR